jgi:hypothetical protein
LSLIGKLGKTDGRNVSKIDDLEKWILDIFLKSRFDEAIRIIER